MEKVVCIYALLSLFSWCLSPGFCSHFFGPKSCEGIYGVCMSGVRGGFLWMAVSEMRSRNSAGVFEELLGDMLRVVWMARLPQLICFHGKLRHY